MKIFSIALFALAVIAAPGFFSRFRLNRNLKVLAKQKDKQFQRLAFAHVDFVNALQSPVFEGVAEAPYIENEIYDAVVRIVQNICDISAGRRKQSKQKNLLQHSIKAYLTHADYFEQRNHGNEKNMFLFKQAIGSYNNILTSYLPFLKQLDIQLFNQLERVVDDVASLNSDSHKKARKEHSNNVKLIGASLEAFVVGDEDPVNPLYNNLRDIVELVFQTKTCRGSDVDKKIRALMRYRNKLEELLSDYANHMVTGHSEQFDKFSYVSAQVLKSYDQFFK